MKRLWRCVGVFLIALAPAVAFGQDKFFDSNGVRIRYVEQGSGPAVVLVHGYTSSVERGWVDTGVLGNLAKDYRVVALDLRGHGKSDKPHDPKAYADLGQEVVRLLDHLKIPQAHLVGYSMGGNVTAKLLTTNPDRFLTAVIGGASGRRGWTDKDAEDAEAAAVELEHGVPYRALILQIAPTDQPRPTEEAIRKRSQEIVALNDPLAHAALLRARRGLAVSDAQMAAVKVPALAIVGSADPALPGVNTLKAVWPALKVVVIQGAVHSSANERGAQRRPEFVAAIREFISAHTKRPT